MCTLRAQSANARVDYDGECEQALGENPEQICARVNQANRCTYNASNCRHLVRPEEGCCTLCGEWLSLSLSLSPLFLSLFSLLPFLFSLDPSLSNSPLCFLSLPGGILFIAMDLAGLRNYVNINPRVRTLDAFVEVLVDSDFIDETITERCELDASFTVTGNVQITLSARTDDDSEFCNSASEMIANAINDLSSTELAETSLFAQTPEILQFASAAVAAPNLAAVVDEIDGANGAPVLAVSSFFTLLLLVTLILALL